MTTRIRSRTSLFFPNEIGLLIAGWRAINHTLKYISHNNNKKIKLTNILQSAFIVPCQ